MRAQLERILASSDFDASLRNRRFLSYIVEETVAGRGDRIKAYSIAVAVFDRDDRFDPQTDPIVRIEASRLRRSLERFYLLGGAREPIRIEIPKGGYVPAFRPMNGSGDEVIEPEPGNGEQQQVPETPPPPPAARQPSQRRFFLLAMLLLGAVALSAALSAFGASWLRQPDVPSGMAAQDPALRQGAAILVAAFEDDSVDYAHPAFSHGFTREVIASLTRFSDLLVFGPETSFRPESQAGLADATGPAVDFVLKGGVAASGSHFAVTATLMDAQSGQYVWSGKFEGALAPEEVLEVRDDLADQVARTLGQPYGVIFTHKAAELQGRPPESFTSYECVLLFHQYWKDYELDLHAPVRQCLEQAIAEDPHYADAHASLAVIEADAYRFGLDAGRGSDDPLARALALALRAVELEPTSTHAYHALHLVYWLMNEVDRSLEAGERGLALNPNDTGLMADLGLRYGLRTHWDKALPLVQQAYARNPGQSGQYRLALFLHHYLEGRYEEALAEARKVEARSVVYGHIALAMAYGQLGRREEAKAAVCEILKIDPGYAEKVVPDLEKRNVHPDLIRLVAEGLGKAGLGAVGCPSSEDS